MIISDEQVRRVLDYLRTTEAMDVSVEGAKAYGVDLSPEQLEHLLATIDELPEVRPERIAEARRMLAGPAPTAEQVAEKMLGRVISDAVR